MTDMIRIEFSGRVSRDAEIRDAGQTQIARVSVAITVPDKDGQGVLFLDLKAFPPMANKLSRLRKGDQIYAIATAKTTKWTGKDGKTHYQQEVWPVFLNTLAKSAAAAAPSAAPAADPSEPPEVKVEVEDDDIPF